MDKIDKSNIGIILLAAGQSTRLESPKQLLEYEGQTLLQHSLHEAQASQAHPVVVVLGADAEKIKKEVEGENAVVAFNTDWQEGMASSIRLGLKELSRVNPGAEGAVVVVCDQPYVTAEVLNKLIAVHLETQKPLVGCQYADTVGTPALFHKSMFPELLKLEGEGGGKEILLKYPESLEIIPFPEGKIDIDTESDYKRLTKEG